MASSYKNPPIQSKELPYEKWKKEDAIWQKVVATEVPKATMAPSVALSLTGNFRDVATGRAGSGT